jgi:toxin ParE1/3/4
MKALSFTPRAAADINSIWDYSAANWGADQADAYTDALRDTCRTLASGKRKGRATTVRPDFLKLNCRSHVIWYRDLPDRLEIIRILHGAQDVERHLHD